MASYFTLSASQDKLLFLKGVRKSDCKKIDELFQEHITQQVAKTEIEKFDKIPTIFTDITLWPKTTNLHCWFCSRQIKSMPVFIPSSIEPVSEGKAGVKMQERKSHQKTYSMNVDGIFCWFNCAQAYIDDSATTLEIKQNRTMMLRFLFRVFTGKSIEYIKPAPPKTKLEQYGGIYTQQEYQKQINSMGVSYNKEIIENSWAAIQKTMRQTSAIEESL